MKEPDPEVYPPPCSQTITGLRPFAGPGVHTFKRKQSSLAGSLRSTAATSGIKPDGPWGDLGPNSRASRTPAQESGLDGGIKRRTPAVDAPYGMPKKALTLSRVMPRTRPAVVRTTALGDEQPRSCAGARRNAPRIRRPAVAVVPYPRKDLRFIVVSP